VKGFILAGLITEKKGQEKNLLREGETLGRRQTAPMVKTGYFVEELRKRGDGTIPNREGENDRGRPSIALWGTTTGTLRDAPERKLSLLY